MRLRDAHFYRKVPRDVSEATKLGGLVSLFAIGTIAWLVYEEYSSYRSERQVTKMGLDNSMMPTPLGEEAFDSVRVNFNISMLRIPCQYASLQVADHVGSHQMGGARNTHKVRLDKNGQSIGMYQPHKYSEDANANLAEHVFPWHKQMHTQGDAKQRIGATRQGLSAEQEVIVAGVEDKMQHSSAGKKALKPVAPTARKLLSFEPEDGVDAVARGPARVRSALAGGPVLNRGPTGRRLLSVEPGAAGAGAEAAVDGEAASANAVPGGAAAAAQPAAKEAPAASTGTAAQGPAAGTAAAAAQGAGAADPAQPAPATAGKRDKSLLRPDASQSCVQWRDAGECLKNSAFMLFKCQTSCAEVANANACRTWAAERSRCNDGARAFMDNFCDGYCDQSPPAEPGANAPASPQANSATPEAVVNTAHPVTAANDAKPEAAANAAEPQVATSTATPEAATQQAAAGAAPKADGPAADAETTAERVPSDGAAAAGAAPAAAGDSNAGAADDSNGGAAASDSADKGSGDGDGPAEDDFIPGPFDESPAKLTETEFEALAKRQPALMVNFYAPWCFWSQKLMPAWLAVARRLHKRAYSQSISFLHVDCTQESGRALCQKQSVHAFPSIRSYRGSVHAFEPYEHGREENVIWLHLVKLAAEAVVERVKDSTLEERQPFATQISHISEDLKVAMERREQGLDEDWTDDALSPEEEVAEDKELLDKIHSAAISIVSAKGVHPTELVGDMFKMQRAAEGQAVQDRSADVVLGLLRSDRKPPAQVDEEGNALEPWLESETHEGCMIFGYVDVSRAPGTIHISPHSNRHSFDFANVNTSHHIDHLSFGLELGAFQRELLPAEVRRHLKPLDGRSFITSQPHETQEHHVNIVPTSYRHSIGAERIETYQFTATSNARTKDTLPSMLISYDVSPIQVHISTTSEPFSDLIVSLCAIIGGAFTIFGILDAIVFTSGKALRKKLA